MARSPAGVATRVSGEAHTQLGHPTGHVAPISAGSWHSYLTWMTGTAQQIWPCAQQLPPQQNEPGAHGTPASSKR